MPYMIICSICNRQRGQKNEIGKPEGIFIVDIFYLLTELFCIFRLLTANLILCSIVNYSLLTMSESTKRPHDGDSEDSADDLIGPVPSEAAKPKKHKCKSLQ